MSTYNKFWLAVILLLVIVGLGNIAHRVKTLEDRCDGRCHYGDTACRDHCAKLGHCPMQNM